MAATPPTAETTPTTENEIKPEDAKIQQLLSTCERCHRLRRKCDTQLPSCRRCEKARADCTIFDHALQESIPRSYVDSLLKRRNALQAMVDAQQVSTQGIGGQLHGPVVSPSQAIESSFDLTFLFSNLHGKVSRYYGTSSVFSLTVEVLSFAHIAKVLSGEIGIEATGIEDIQFPKHHQFISTSLEPEDHVISRVNTFLVAENIMYGILDPFSTLADTQVYLKLRISESGALLRLQGLEAHQYFRISMVCAISCANQARHEPRLLTQSMNYYVDALCYLEEVSSEASAESLQALQLLIVFSLFSPHEGDIWRLLSYACRLSIELGYHAEPRFLSAEYNKLQLQRASFWGLYALERVAGQLFGRPCEIPDTIIATKYPDQNIRFPGDGHAIAFHSPDIAHHYKLVFLRSRLYSQIYLPARVPPYPEQWYTDQCNELTAWRQGLNQTDPPQDIVSITCELAYHCTVILLFQSWIMKGLQQLQAPADAMFEGERVTVARDSYWAACRLISIYEGILRSPRSSPSGTFPLTFISAHHIYLAGLTVMAHCLLALDDRVKFISMIDSADDASENHSDCFQEAHVVAGSCLVLLSWCVQRWPGMVGMLNVYKKLFDAVIPKIMRLGL
ncbi:hypothetical protein ASPVEDRAFT_84852 [Aspergillus versicolor CBS 583.65]|uniref:Zn(2)-C6 fungal-type domain-containing protein n=1 Tax=Aspergillus versicolor CBS 583.65 TaxID=1036611 RepID=A0A1L9PPP3_ASPVE|nr:uncharacterized protein ASPVEDRAFT_84852 [Aspergillus versicolor CBS 583.65]OJJ03405.1 hypothetical protein ASPVEDRAFT_84852 [Aspergillus versicolor CBS 583.65]